MYCSNHPMAYAVGVCASCGKAICQNCGVVVDNKLMCKPCAQAGQAPGAGRSAKAAVDGAGQNRKSDDALPKLLLVAGLAVAAIIAVIVIIGVLVIAAGVIAAFVFGMSSGTTKTTHTPGFTVMRLNDTSIVVKLHDAGGAASVKGLIVQQPSLDNPIVVDPDTSIAVGQSITITDPKLAGGPVQFVAVSAVDGEDRVVLDAII